MNVHAVQPVTTYPCIHDTWSTVYTVKMIKKNIRTTQCPPTLFDPTRNFLGCMERHIFWYMQLHGSELHMVHMNSTCTPIGLTYRSAFLYHGHGFLSGILMYMYVHCTLMYCTSIHTHIVIVHQYADLKRINYRYRSVKASQVYAD